MELHPGCPSLLENHQWSGKKPILHNTCEKILARFGGGVPEDRRAGDRYLGCCSRRESSPPCSRCGRAAAHCWDGAATHHRDPALGNENPDGRLVHENQDYAGVPQHEGGEHPVRDGYHEHAVWCLSRPGRMDGGRAARASNCWTGGRAARSSGCWTGATQTRRQHRTGNK